MSVKEKNRAILENALPRLLEVYENAEGSPSIEILAAKNSAPIFKYKDSAFHGIYKPEDEAERLLAELPPDAKNVFVFGLGYGHHLRALMATGAAITVLEPSADIFKSAAENADLSAILERCAILVGNDIFNAIEKTAFEDATLIPHRPYTRFFSREWTAVSTAFTARTFIAKKRPKVMVVGPIYGGSEPTFRYVRDALKGMGVETVAFDASPFAAGNFALDKVTKEKQRSEKLKGDFTRLLADAAVAMAEDEKPDLVIALAQAPLDIPALEEFARLKIPTAFWFVEDFRTMGYWEQMARHYDYFFIIQRGQLFTDKLNAAGVKKTAYIPQAASPEVHKPLDGGLSADEKKKYGSDVSFMGAGYHNRQIFFTGLLDYDFKVWGTEWNLNSELGKKVANKNQRLKPEEYVKIFSASKINLNLHSSTKLAGIDPAGDFVNPRVFELAACGAFSLVDNRAELAECFDLGTEVVTFDSIEDLRKKIDFYLQNEEARKKVAESARARALAYHTFERRMETMLAFIAKAEGPEFPRKREEAEKRAENPRNIVREIIREAGGDKELVEYLAHFDAEKPFDIKLVADKIHRDVWESKDGPKPKKLNRVESLMLILHEFMSFKGPLS